MRLILKYRNHSVMEFDSNIIQRVHQIHVKSMWLQYMFDKRNCSDLYFCSYNAVNDTVAQFNNVVGISGMFSLCLCSVS